MGPEQIRAAFERLTCGTKRVLLVEGHAWFREALAYLIDLDRDLLVVHQADSLDDLRTGAVGYDVILADLDPFRGRAADLVCGLQECSSRAPLLALTGYPDLDLHLRALEGGADMFLLKSASVQEILRSVKLLAAPGSGVARTRRTRP